MLLAAHAAAAVLALLGAIHVFWAARGATTGRGFVPERQGQPLFRPGRLATLAVAVALFAAASLVLGQLGVWGSSVPRVLFQVGSGGVALAFLARSVGDFRYVGFFKRVRGTRFATLDTALFSPLALAIALGCAAAVVGAGR